MHVSNGCSWRCVQDRGGSSRGMKEDCAPIAGWGKITFCAFNTVQVECIIVRVEERWWLWQTSGVNVRLNIAASPTEELLIQHFPFRILLLSCVKVRSTNLGADVFLHVQTLWLSRSNLFWTGKQCQVHIIRTNQAPAYKWNLWRRLQRNNVALKWRMGYWRKM